MARLLAASPGPISPGATCCTTARFRRPRRSKSSPTCARASSPLSAGTAITAAVRAGFGERDRTLAAFREHEETVLWFEHDLYDQLQLLQILDWLSRQDRDAVRISLIQIDRHAGVSPFFGLGQLSGRQLAELLPVRQPVSPEQFAIGREAWAAFCAPDPTGLAALANSSIPEMPFLSAALTRCLEQYPRSGTACRAPNASCSRPARRERGTGATTTPLRAAANPVPGATCPSTRGSICCRRVRGLPSIAWGRTNLR